MQNVRVPYEDVIVSRARYTVTAVSPFIVRRECYGRGESISVERAGAFTSTAV